MSIEYQVPEFDVAKPQLVTYIVMVKTNTMTVTISSSKVSFELHVRPYFASRNLSECIRTYMRLHVSSCVTQFA